jgi:hypothetical protein
MVTILLDPLSILGPPFRGKFTPDDSLRTKIAGYFSAVMRKARKDIKPKLPLIMPAWGRVRIAQGGDSIRSVLASGKSRTIME